MASQTNNTLHRSLGVWGATWLGLGSIVGTGVFVAVAMGVTLAGPMVLLATMLAMFVATCNGMSSAQLAAAHPVSGGTYTYGRIYLGPVVGFSAGWLFLCAKTASAATATLGFAGYFLNLIGIGPSVLIVPIGLFALFCLTAVVLAGLRRSNVVNATIVSLTVLTLLFFIITGLLTLGWGDADTAENALAEPMETLKWTWPGFFEACALMFVAYTGYGRIATMGEEIIDPARNIPRAMMITLVSSMLLYMGVALVLVSAVGTLVSAESLSDTAAAPLEVVARTFAIPGAGVVLAIGAMLAMLGVLLNLILGLSRVILAMGREYDMPPITSRLTHAGTPAAAILVVAVMIGLLVLVGDVRLTWSFSALTVLIYYALTNLSALRLPKAQQRYPRWLAWGGLAGCLFLAIWVDPSIWAAGVIVLIVGLIWRKLCQMYFRNRHHPVS